MIYHTPRVQVLRRTRRVDGARAAPGQRSAGRNCAPLKWRGQRRVQEKSALRGDVSFTGEAQKEDEETEEVPTLVSEEDESAVGRLNCTPPGAVSAPTATTDGVLNRAIDEFDRLAVPFAGIEE